MRANLFSAKILRLEFEYCFLGVDFSRSTHSLIFFLEFRFKQLIIVSEIALGSSKVGVFSSVVVGVVVYEED